MQNGREGPALRWNCALKGETGVPYPASARRPVRNVMPGQRPAAKIVGCHVMADLLEKRRSIMTGHAVADFFEERRRLAARGVLQGFALGNRGDFPPEHQPPGILGGLTGPDSRKLSGDQFASGQAADSRSGKKPRIPERH